MKENHILKGKFPQTFPNKCSCLFIFGWEWTSPNAKSSQCFTGCTVAVALLSCLVKVCAVLGEHLLRSQPAGHSSLVINVYWHNIDTLRSHFLVCKWKMLLECHTKRGVGAFPPCTSFPSVFRGLNVCYCGCRVLSVLFLFHCLTVFVFFSQHLTVLGRIFSFEKVGLEVLWLNRLCCFYGINRILLLYWNIVRACILRAMKKNRPKLDHNIIYSWKAFFFLF